MRRLVVPLAVVAALFAPVAAAASTVFSVDTKVSVGQPFMATFTNPAVQDLRVVATFDKVAGNAMYEVRLDNWQTGDSEFCDQLGTGYLFSVECSVPAAAAGEWRVSVWKFGGGKVAVSIVVTSA